MPSYSQYLRQRAIMDAQEEDITWITVKGNHIPIKNGQNKGEAIKEFFESKKSGGKKNKTKERVELTDLQGNKYTTTKQELEEAGTSKFGLDPKGIKPAILEPKKGETKKSVFPSAWSEKKDPMLEEEKRVQKYHDEEENAEADFKKLRSSFGSHYDKLYNDIKLDNESDYLLREWDKHIEDPKFKKQVQKFVEARGDFISSDREVKAFMLAAKEHGLIPDEKVKPQGGESGGVKREKSQPADIMDWSFNDVMKLPISDNRVVKYIAKNHGLKESTVATLAEAFGNTEDLYMMIDRVSDKKGYGWDA